MTDWGRKPPQGEKPKFAPGDRVIWHAKHNGKDYPATVDSVDWFRRTAEPWQYTISLDQTPATKRLTYLLRFPGESRLSAEDGA
jgi:hypothetical protein